jgi:hypothetical protein
MKKVELYSLIKESIKNALYFNYRDIEITNNEVETFLKELSKYHLKIRREYRREKESNYKSIG